MIKYYCWRRFRHVPMKPNKSCTHTLYVDKPFKNLDLRERVWFQDSYGRFDQIHGVNMFKIFLSQPGRFMLHNEQILGREPIAYSDL